MGAALKRHMSEVSFWPGPVPGEMSQVDPVASFALGTFIGSLMGFVSLFVVLRKFLRNLQEDDLDGANWSSFGGLVLPSFFFQGAADIYGNVREVAAKAQQQFRSTGDFEDIYKSIEDAQKEQVLNGLRALRDRFPR
ncbi:hypothetical protein AK812_SmicGene10680 [Symbiodinium microadriaticum]|uniref:Uncharacterized protein n=1 Tax=Symbiodinium microadriaticum TaxID=2951 RepID=A0A1Q9EFA7_SYMMI|nr:hypothetical protein AK812_SmicGene10680 [Symbiodinium microadriaticum]